MAWLVRFRVDEGSVELASSLLWDAGTTGILDEGDRLVAGFDDRDRAERAAARLHPVGAVVESIEPYRWTGSDQATTVSLRPGHPSGPELTIAAGTAFGHGRHPTTALAIELLADTVRPGDRVLDVGTGSGVLAIAAGALGAGPVVGIDIDPVAVEVAWANAEANGVAVVFGLEPVAGAPGLVGGHPFDVVVANVLLPVQRELAVSMAGVLGPGGSLITTGYLIGDSPTVEALHLEALARNGSLGAEVVEVEVAERRSAGGWGAHRFVAGRDRDGAGRASQVGTGAQGRSNPSAPPAGSTGSAGRSDGPGGSTASPAG